MSRYFNIAIWEYDFYSKHWLWLLVLVPIVLFLLYFLQNKQHGHLKFSGESSDQKKYEVGFVKYYRWTIFGFYGLGLACLFVPLAEPYHTEIDPPKIDYKNGIDIIIAMDISGSMMAEDFTPNRLEVAKNMAIDFVSQRKGDRIGLVVYEGEAYTAVPATLDYPLLAEQIKSLESGHLEGGTAIGNGLGLAVTRLRSDSLKSKVIILLTDGANNAGTIDPREAAELAKSKNCTVYTIGMGAEAGSLINTPFGPMPSGDGIDEPLMRDIASTTGGLFFRATDEAALKSIYSKIDVLEKRKMENQHIGKDPPVTIFPFFLYGFLFIIIAWSIQRWKFKLDE